MRILGAKFKFSVGHGKFNFPPLYAESFGRIPIVSFAIETIIAVALKKHHTDYSLKKFCIFFDRYAKKWLQERQRCELGLVGRPMLSPEYALFVRLRWGGWNFLFGLLGLVLPQIPAQKRHVFTSVPSSS